MAFQHIILEKPELDRLGLRMVKRYPVEPDMAAWNEVDRSVVQFEHCCNMDPPVTPVVYCCLHTDRDAQSACLIHMLLRAGMETLVTPHAVLQMNAD